jgi:hypothetical protein
MSIFRSLIWKYVRRAECEKNNIHVLKAGWLNFQVGVGRWWDSPKVV